MSDYTERKAKPDAQSAGASCASHTPGPWMVLRDDWKYQFIKAGDKTVAEVTLFGDESPHDARLIAAAPELLEALIGLAWLATPHFSDKAQLEHLEFCEAVIKKAKGQ